MDAAGDTSHKPLDTAVMSSNEQEVIGMLLAQSNTDIHPVSSSQQGYLSKLCKMKRTLQYNNFIP